MDNDAEVVILEKIDDKYVTEIGTNAFADCLSLEKISLPASLRNLGIFAFKQCTSLKKITIPGSLSNWEYSTFFDSGLEEVIIEEGITEIPYNSFYGTKLKEVKLSESIQKIGFYAFKVLEKQTFSHTALETVTFEEGTETIGEIAFSFNKRIKNITLPKNMKTISWGAFMYCSLEVISLNEGLQSIETGAFDSTSLKELVIPKQLKI